MKLRTDFVTNSSSSSSFVVAYKELDKSCSENKLHNAVVNMVINSENYCETEPARVINTKEELDKFYLDVYGYRNQTIKDILLRDSDVSDEYKECLRYIHNGYKIMMKSVAYGDYTMNELMKLLADTSDNFVFIGEDGN